MLSSLIKKKNGGIIRCHRISQNTISCYALKRSFSDDYSMVIFHGVYPPAKKSAAWTDNVGKTGKPSMR